MEYQKITNLLDNASNQPSKFETRNWVEINDESRGTYTSNNIEFKTTMLGPDLCDYSGACILVNGRITIDGARNDDVPKQADERDKGVTFKNFTPFNKCISRINNTDTDNAQNIDFVMHNLIEYSDNYSKTSGSLWQYYKDEPKNNIAEYESFKSKGKITGQTPADRNTKDIEITLPLKYLTNFWRTLEMPWINCEVNLILTSSIDCVITNSTGAAKFTTTETKHYVFVATFLEQDNAKLLQQLKSGFKRLINWDKYESNLKTFAGKRYLNHLINPSFPGVNKLYVLSWK